MTAIFIPRRPTQYKTPLGLFLSDSFFHAGLFSYILFESVRLPQTIINVYHVLCSLRRLKTPVTELQNQSALHEG